MELLKEDFELRLYQQKILNTALNNNSLVVLPTGLGKTFIGIALAALRIKNGGKAVMLAPTKPLANQHKQRFEKWMSGIENISLLTGETRPSKRGEIWDRSRIVTATPQTIENDLMAGRISFDDVKLMVFDECLTGETKILLANGSKAPIKRVVDKFLSGEEIYVYTLDTEKNSFVVEEVLDAQKIPCVKRLIQIKEEGGRKIELTEDHEVLIRRDGEQKWVEAGDLSINDKIANFPKRIEHSKKSEHVIKDNDITKTYKKKPRKNVRLYRKVLGLRRKFRWGYRKISKKLEIGDGNVRNWLYEDIKPKPLKMVEELKEMGILPLTYSNPNLRIIARIVGHIFGDGWFSVSGGNKFSIGFSGKKEDLKRIQSDLELLGINYSSIYSRKTKSKVEKTKIKGETNHFVCSSSLLGRLLLALEVPKGEKVKKDIEVPKWIREGPRFVKREFLSSLFGSDADKPQHKEDSRSFYAIRYRINKAKGLEGSGLRYMNQIKKLLREFDIETKKIRTVKRNKREDGTKTIKIKLTISNSIKNLITFLEEISYTYCAERERTAVKSLNYLLEKKRSRLERAELSKIIPRLKQGNYENRVISKMLGLPTKEVVNLQRSSYESMAPLSFPTFGEWEKKNPNTPVQWKKIEGISVIEKKDFVYDITVEDTHNFIANDTVVHNCHRSRKGYSYVFLAKQYYKLADDPRVLGLTASPGYDKGRIMKVCDNLGIEEIEVRSEDDPDVQPYVKKKKMERVVLELPEELEKVKKGMERAMKVRLSKLKERGFTESKSLDKVYKSDLLDLQGELRSKIGRGDADPPVYNAITLTAACLKISHALELLQTQGVKPLVSYLKKLKKDSSRAAKQLRKDKWFKNATLKAYNLYENGKEHPKFEKLEEIIEKSLEEGDKRIIVFTQYRATVDRIVEFLKEREKINPIKFIGQSKKDGLTQKQQIKRLREFREGKYNCLVATSVAEEGLDVKEADLAIFFEPVPSALRSVQRKGRVGRTKVGEIYVMYTKDCIDEKYYWIAYHREKKMKKALNKLSEELGEEQKSMEDFK